MDHLREEFEKYSLDLSSRAPKYFREFKENLISGIEYYRSLTEQVIEEQRNRFLDELRCLGDALEGMTLVKPLNEMIPANGTPSIRGAGPRRIGRFGTDTVNPLPQPEPSAL